MLLTGFLRLYDITTLPSGLSDEEITNIRIVETARDGTVKVFYSLGDEGRDGVYPISLAFFTSLTGKGMWQYRLPSIWAGMLASALIYAAGKRLFGVIAGLSALALMAVSFWPILLSRQVTPATLLPLLVTSTLLSLMTILPANHHHTGVRETTAAATGLGILLGLGLYIHPAGLLMLVFSLAYVLYAFRTEPYLSRRTFNTHVSLTLLLMLIIGMPYVISSIRSPDLSGTNRLIGENPRFSLQTMVQALGGIIFVGDQNPLHNLPERPLYDLVSGAFIIIGLAAAIWGWRKRQHMLLILAMVVLSPVFLLAANAPDFLNYAVALPLLTLLFGLGVQRMWEPLSRQYKHIASLGLALLLLLNLNWTVDDLFGDWPNSPEVENIVNGRLGRLANYVDRTADDTPTVICGWGLAQSPGSPALSDAQLIALMMTRKNAPVRYVDCYNALVITDGGEGQQIILPKPEVFGNTHPQLRVWFGQGQLQQEEGLPEDGVLRLEVEGALANAMGRIIEQSPVSYAPESGGNPDELVKPPIRFGNNVTLLGYISQESTVYQPGETVAIITYWRIEGVVPRDLMLFTHILSDPGASPPANTDVISVNPHNLEDRDILVQVTYVPLPESLPVGDYQISIGAYQRTSGARLPVLEDGVERGARLFLYSITVEETG